MKTLGYISKEQHKIIKSEDETGEYLALMNCMIDKHIEFLGGLDHIEITRTSIRVYDRGNNGHANDFRLVVKN